MISKIGLKRLFLGHTLYILNYLRHLKWQFYILSAKIPYLFWDKNLTSLVKKVQRKYLCQTCFVLFFHLLIVTSGFFDCDLIGLLCLSRVRSVYFLWSSSLITALSGQFWFHGVLTCSKTENSLIIFLRCATVP